MRAKRVLGFVIPSMLCTALVSATVASAQTRPYTPPGQQQQQQPPPPNGGMPEATQPGAVPAPPMNGGFQQSYYPEYYDYGTGYPGVEVRAVPSALTRRAIARAEYRRLQSGLDLMIGEMRKAFERSRDYSQAVADEREAFENYDRERNEALASLRDDPNYQASVSLRQSLTDQIADRRESRHTSPYEILAMAEVKMGYASTASQMEAAALAADPDVQQARERVRRASARVNELRQQHNQEVRSSPELEVARRNLQDARIGKLAAEVYYDGVREARNIALHYAYHTHRYDKYKYLSYGYYGYNYPYDHGYRGGYQVGYPINWR